MDPKQNKLDSFGFGAEDQDDDITEVKAADGNNINLALVKYQPIRHLHMCNRSLRLTSTSEQNQVQPEFLMYLKRGCQLGSSQLTPLLADSHCLATALPHICKQVRPHDYIHSVLQKEVGSCRVPQRTFGGYKMVQCNLIISVMHIMKIIK